MEIYIPRLNFQNNFLLKELSRDIKYEWTDKISWENWKHRDSGLIYQVKSTLEVV